MYAQPPTASPPSSAGLNSQLASDLKLQVDALRKRGAKNGAYRLREVIDHFQYYTVEGAARYICRDDIVDELENQPFWLLSLLRGLRNVLSIAPIVITWFALYSAANAYVKDLAATRDDLYQPFLLLWQKGFHGQIPPFASAALFDFLALLFLVFIIIAIPVLEHRRRNALQKSLSSFDALLNDLLEAIGQGGANAHLADSDINKITQAIQSTLGRLMMGYDRVADEARKFVEDTHEKTKQLVKNFDDNLVVFNSDVRLLTNDLQKSNQNLKQMSAASTKMADSSSQLASNTRDLADNARLNTQASKDIGNHLSDLNSTQQTIIQTQKDAILELGKTQQQVVSDVTTSQQSIVQKIADSQKVVVDQLTGAADVVERSGKNTRDAANNLGQVAANLEQLTRSDFQTMTNGVIQANQDLVSEVRKTSGEVQQVAQNLSQVNAQLQQTTQSLAAAAQALATAVNVQKKRGFWPWQW